ncbi:MAG: phosphoribosylformylglycinamidine synthase II [Owenweeksia sp. TMED14]|nr:MAG: phosphoribosylformylglycinamidine synthase II [Owenweeksia sp. TMED14]
MIDKLASWDTIDFSSSSDAEITKTLKELNIPLSIDEVKKIQFSFLNRPATLTELVLFSIQGSEHSSYKSSKNHIKHFVTYGDHVILGAKDDAGIVSLSVDDNGNRYGLVVSHESHNHPSQIVPYEGAATGVGGNVRDVCCMGAEVMSLGDSLRFGDINRNKTKWISDGVVSGIAGYGNPLGIPNICGDLYFDKEYNENCLVTVLTAGIVKEKNVIRSKAPKNSVDYDLILVGKPTDNSGFGGASFASLELEEEKEQQNKGAVQEPNAFLERHILKSTYALFDFLEENNLINKVGFKDLGAGGVACASIELADAAGLGAEVWVDKIHTSMPEIDGHIILCSETQERFMWASPKDLTQTILDHYNKVFDFPNVSVGAKASVVGKIINEKHYSVFYKDQKIVDGPIEKINEGFVYNRPMSENKTQLENDPLPEKIDYNNLMLKILSHENVASRAPVYESYDKNVQGRVINERGKTNAGVVAPFDSKKFPKEIKDDCFSAALAHNPSIGKIDPYLVAQHAVIEACAKTVSVGASPLALTDCLCFGNPEKPDQMWQFSQSCIAIRETCSLLHFNGTDNLPIVAGNVSFYNQSGNQSIPASPMIGCFGKVSKDQVLMNGFKSSDANIYLVGETPEFIGGSIVVDLLNIKNTKVKKIDVQKYSNMLNSFLKANSEGLVSSGSYVGLGGLATSLCKMSFVNNVGFSIEKDIDKNLLFSENFAFIVEVSEESSSAFEDILNKNKCAYKQIGKTNKSNKIVVKNFIDLDVSQTKKTWKNALREKLQ